MMRPTGLAPGQYQPLAAPLAIDMGDWDPEKYERRREAPTGIRVSRSSIEGDEEPLLNVTPAGESLEERSGPLAWIGKPNELSWLRRGLRWDDMGCHGTARIGWLSTG